MSRRLYTLAIALAALAAPMAASAQYGGRTVRCESDDHRTEVCRIDTRGGVRIVDQESRAPCVSGRTWGYDSRGIWVSQGCRARFQVGSSAYARSSRYDDRYYGGNTGYYGNNSGYYGNHSGYYGNSGYY